MKAKAKRPRRRRWLRALVWTFGIGTLLVFATVFGLLYSTIVARIVVAVGVGIYADAIPGDVTIGHVDGRIAGDLVLHDVRLEDGEGNPLIEVDRLRLGVSVPAALTGRLDLGRLELSGARVTLPAEGAPGFGDLAPPSTEDEPPPDDEGLGPDLPLRIEAALGLEDFTLVDGGDASVMVTIAALELQAWGAGRRAEASLRLDGAVPMIELPELRLALQAAWDDPQARVSELDLRTSWGTVTLADAGIDLEHLRGTLDELVVEADSDWVQTQLGLRPAAAWRLTASAAGDPSDATVALELQAPDWVTADVKLSGRPSPPFDVAMELRLAPGPAVVREIAWAPTVPPAVLLTAAVQGDPQDELSARLDVQCPTCDPRGGPISLVARADGAPAVPRGHVDARFDGAGVGVHIDASLATEGELRAKVELEAPDLARVAEVAERFVELPDLAGHAHARLDCTGTIEPLTAGCEIEVGLRDARPVRFVDLATRVQLGETLEVGVDRLRVEAPPVRLGLASGTPRIVIDGERLRVEDVDLRVAVGKTIGRVVASGRRNEAGEHVLDLGVRGVELAGLDSVVPDLGLRGRVDLQAHLAGTMSDPALDARLGARNLGWQEHELGSLDANLGYRDGRARLSLRSPSGPLQSLRVDLNMPVALPSDGVAAGLRGRAPARASVRLDDFDLAVAAAFAPEPVAIDGRLDLDASLEGTLARPRLDLTLTGRELVFDGTAMGDLKATVGYAANTGQAKLELSHPSVRTATVELETALGLDFATPRVTWSPGAAHRAHVLVEAAQLAMVSPWLPEPALGGTLDLELRSTGNLVEPQLDAHLAVHELSVDERLVGSFASDMGYADDAAWLRASGSGPALEGLGITARVPLRLSPGTGAVEWKSRDAHELDVALVGLHLQEVMAWLPEPLDLEGRGDTFVHVRGPATAPAVETSLAFDRLRYGGRTVGRLELDARLADALASADLRLHRDASRFVVVEAAVPVTVDAAAGDARWLSDRPHRLHVLAPRIDPELLAPFVELPDALDFELALLVDGKGNLDAPTVDLGLDGHVELEGSPRQRLESKVTIEAASQRAEILLGSRERPLLAVEAQLGLPIATAARGEASIDTTPVQVDARADLDLALVDGLAPELVANATGRLDLRAAVGGTLGNPSLDGLLAIQDAALTVVPLRQRFEAVGLDVSLTRDRIVLSSLNARSGRGTLRASGTVELADTSGELVLQGRRVPLRKPGLPHMELTTDVRTTLSTRDDTMHIGVEVRDTRVDVTLTQAAAAKSIPSNSRVRYVELDDRPAMQRPELTERQSEDSTSGPAIGLDLKLANPVRIMGPSVDMAWDGRVQVDLGGDTVKTDGALQTREGFFDLFGNQFRIEEGSVFIPPGRDGEPFVDLTAITQVAEVQITVHVRGRVSRPELVFSSTPAMTQSQIFTMLLTGSPDVEGADGDNVEARAASLLAAFSNPALQRQLNERLGVDRIGVGFGERTDQPILSAGKYLGKKVYVETQYRHNSAPNENRAQLMMRYRIAPRWNLETVFGDAAAGGIDLFWGKAFDTRPRRSTPTDTSD